MIRSQEMMINPNPLISSKNSSLKNINKTNIINDIISDFVDVDVLINFSKALEKNKELFHLSCELKYNINERIKENLNLMFFEIINMFLKKETSFNISTLFKKIENNNNFQEENIYNDSKFNEMFPYKLENYKTKTEISKLIKQIIKYSKIPNINNIDKYFDFLQQISDKKPFIQNTLRALKENEKVFANESYETVILTLFKIIMRKFTVYSLFDEENTNDFSHFVDDSFRLLGNPNGDQTSEEINEAAFEKMENVFSSKEGDVDFDLNLSLLQIAEESEKDFFNQKFSHYPKDIKKSIEKLQNEIQSREYNKTSK
jgi:hypothetical protein